MAGWNGHIKQFSLKKCVWCEYKIELEKLFEFVSFKFVGYTDEKKANFVRSVLDKECYDLLSEVCAPELLSYSELIELCDAKFNCIENVFRARYKFYNARRTNDQSPFDWAQHVKRLAVDCGFKGDIQTTLRDRFITGLSGPLLDRMFEEDDELSFVQAVQIAVEYDEMGGSNKKKNSKKRERLQNSGNRKEGTNVPIAESYAPMDIVAHNTMESEQPVQRNSWTVVPQIHTPLGDTASEDLTSQGFHEHDVEMSRKQNKQKQERKFRKTESEHAFSRNKNDSLDEIRERPSVSTTHMDTSIETTSESQLSIVEDTVCDVQIEDEDFYGDKSCFIDTKKEEPTKPKERISITLVETASLNDPHHIVSKSKKDKQTEELHSNQKLTKSYASTAGETPRNYNRNIDGKRNEISVNRSNDRSLTGGQCSQSSRSHSGDGRRDSTNSRGRQSAYRDNSADKTFTPTWRSRSKSLPRDVDFLKFERTEMKYPKDKFDKVEEIESDLFAMSCDYSLGHCVAEDMNMGSGIAVGFRQTFKRIDELLQQRQKQGGLAVLEDKGRYIYYLVTKTVSSGKPTYETLWKSLQKMKEHIIKNDVKKLALPRLGCGLDRLEWSCVKNMLEYVFSTSDVKIVICNFQQTYDMPPPAKLKKCHVVNVSYSIEQIEKLSMIMYLGSEDRHVTKEIDCLDKKFQIISLYKTSTEKVGEVIRTEALGGDYMLYGCVVRKKANDPFSYTDFQKCLRAVEKNNRKDQYEYVGIQAFNDNEDSLIMEKIVNLIRNTLKFVEVYVCDQPEWKCNPQYY